MYSCKGDHWIHSGSLGLTAVLTGNALRNTRNPATRISAQVEPSKPPGALHKSDLLTPPPYLTWHMEQHDQNRNQVQSETHDL
jgi:hypothetical protein